MAMVEARDLISLCAGLLALAGLAVLSIALLAMSAPTATAGAVAILAGVGTLAVQRRRA